MVLSGRWLCKHRVEDKTKANNEAGRKVGREVVPTSFSASARRVLNCSFSTNQLGSSDSPAGT